MGHSSTTNYTVSEVQITNVASGASLPNAAKLYISPNPGFVVGANDFTIDIVPGVTSPEVTMVTFGDYDSNEPNPSVARTTGVPHTTGNIVEVFVYLDQQAVVTGNLDLTVDIDGQARRASNKSINICLTNQVQAEAQCPSNYWPKTGAPISPGVQSIPGGLECLSCFMDVADEPLLTTTSLANNTTWTSPLNGVGGYTVTPGADTATVSQSQATIDSGVVTTLFKKTFWTGPQKSFEVVPFYVLNQAASNSGGYIIEETATDYNVDKTLTAPTNSSNVIECDTADIIPGMQVTGTSLISCAYDPIQNPSPTNATLCWPFWGADIRVTEVDHDNSKVYISESNTLSTGDVLNFSSVHITNFGGPSGLVARRCVAKEFTVKFIGSNDISCGQHIIDWAQMSGTTPMTVTSQPKITQVTLSSDEYLGDRGGSRTLTVQGSKSAATFSVTITRSSDLKTYDFENGEFSAKNNALKDQTIDSTGYYKTLFNIPLSSRDVSYDIVVTPTTNEISYLATTVEENVTTSFTIYQYVDKTLTLTSDATDSSLTLASGLTNITSVARGGIKTTRKIPTWTGNITKADGSVIYINRQPLRATEDDYGDFEFNTTSTTDGNKNNTQITLSPTISGSGTATLTATITGNITQHPTANTTILFDIDNFITVKPSVPSADPENSNIVLYVDRDIGFLDLDIRSIDTDTNKASKTLSTVEPPEHGTLSAYGASGSAWDNGRIRYTVNEGYVMKRGGTDSFVYKATVGGVDSDEAGYGTITVQYR